MTLLLHTSSPTCSLGLADGDRIVAREEFPVGRDLAATLADRLREVLTTHNSELTTLTKIVVHAGPGSFTSLRLGVTTANALAYALQIPIIGVSGPVSTLEELLERSRGVSPSPSNLVVPSYGQDPRLGPIPS